MPYLHYQYCYYSFFSSNIIEDSTKRIINNNDDFKRDTLFNFVLDEENPQIIQYENYDLEVTIEGKALPNEVFVEIDNYKYKLEKIKANRFKYTFVELRKDTKFRLSANNVVSTKYTIDVLEKPEISDFELHFDYPAYTG